MESLHPAFDLVSTNELPEYRGRGLRLKHRKTGCEVYHLSCEDEENTFAFGFRTPSRDGTGAAHIVEHSVLCGSERYPIRDPFLVMARRSLATYLNALTYPDRTIYPASSAVEADYFNLMSVYGDAVFFPAITEETLGQEGHRLEFQEDGSLGRGGVVYNEMRGDYSSADSLIGTALVSGLFEPGHPYSYDSGGNPQTIIDLDYPGFLDFWASNYNPSNCRIFLYGSIDTARQLAFLEDSFLSRENPRWKPRSGGIGDVPVAQARKLPRRDVLAVPPEAGSEGKTSVILSWLLPPLADPAEALAADLLGELLLGHDGAPLALALRNSGLGEDLSPHTGLDTNLRQPIFSAGLRGCKEGIEDQVEGLIISSLEAFAKDGVEAEALDTALHSLVFASKEIRRGSGTYGTRVMTRAYRSWIRGHSPDEGLAVAAPLAKLQATIEADPAWLGAFVRRVLLDNPHRTCLTARPDAGLFEKKEAAELSRLAELQAALSPGEEAAIRASQEKFARIQAQADSPEALATMPRLRSRDLPLTVDHVPRETGTLGDRPISIHPLYTNGIIYLDLAFPLEGVARANYPWLPLLSRVIPAAGTASQAWDKMSALLTRQAGGFNLVLEAGTGSAKSGGTLGSWAIVRLKALSERFPEALALGLDLLSGTDWGDRKRILDIQAELCNDVVSALVPGGNSFALARAGAFRGGALALDDLWRGMAQFRFLSRLSAQGTESPSPEILEALAASIFAREGLRINLTAGREDLLGALASLEKGISRLRAQRAPGPRPEALSSGLAGPAAQREAYAIPAKVGFAAAACPASLLGSPESVHETVLAHLLTTGLLWDELRVKRGAYGASCYMETLEGSALFSTYRDPRPVDSLDYFGQALRELASRDLPGDLVEEAIVGSAGRDLRPLLPEERGLADFRRELYGIDDELRLAKRLSLLKTGPADLARAASSLATAYEGASSVLISRSEDVQLLGHRRVGTLAVDLSL